MTREAIRGHNCSCSTHTVREIAGRVAGSAPSVLCSERAPVWQVPLPRSCLSLEAQSLGTLTASCGASCQTRYEPPESF